eukprot:jgi/Phyca11/116520/e_gw1.31.282.1
MRVVCYTHEEKEIQTGTRQHQAKACVQASSCARRRVVYLKARFDTLAVLYKFSRYNGRQLQELAGFSATIVDGHSTALARVVNSVKEIEGINIQHKPAVVYRAIGQSKARLTVSPEVEYEHLPSFMTAFASVNPGSRVCLQLDSKERFYRLFLSIGCVVAIQDAMLPVWEVDGTHMKHPEYNGVRMETRYPLPLTKELGKKTVRESVSTYLHGIHPTSWTVIGNMPLSSEEQKWLTASWEGIEAYGDALPLFGLTPHAMNLMKLEQRTVGKPTVMPAAIPTFLVFDAFDACGMAGNTKLYEINMVTGQCSRCVAFEQLRIPCRHIQAVIYRLATENKAAPLLYKPLQYFHGAYSVAVLHAAMSTVSIRMPIDCSLEVCQTIKPPPYYRQVGTSLKRKQQKADRAQGCKRKRNKGESTAKSSVTRVRITYRDEAKVEEDDEESEVAAFFETQLSAPTVKERRLYRCGQCGDTGHNAKTCTNANQELEEAGVPIQPGKYLVGDCPFSICGIRSGYEKAFGS